MPDRGGQQGASTIDQDRGRDGSAAYSPMHGAEGGSHRSRPIRGAATAFTDIVSVTFARGVSIGLGLLVAMIATRLLGPSHYAILAYITVISGLMVLVTASWTATSVVRYGREELERSESIRATSWGRLVITGPLLVFAIVVIVLLRLVGALPTALTWEFVAIAIGTGLAALAMEHFINLLEACGRMKLTAVALAMQRVVQIAGLVALIIWGVGHSPAAVALILLVATALLSVGLAGAVWKVGIWPPTVDAKLLRRMLAFSLPMIAFSVSQYVIQAIDVVILGAYRPSRDVGIYAIAYQGFGILQTVATTATIVLSPLFVSLRLAARERLIERYYERTVDQVVLLISVCAGLAAPLIAVVVPLVFGHAFGPAAAPLSILLFAWVLYAAESFVAPILVLHERSRAMGMISAAAAIVNVAGDWILVGVLGVGIIGPAIATAVSFGAILIGYFTIAADAIGARRSIPVAGLAPAAAGITCTLAFHGAAAWLTSITGTAIVTAIVLAWQRPFAADDIELLQKLDIPGPGKQLAIKALSRMS